MEAVLQFPYRPGSSKSVSSAESPQVSSLPQPQSSVNDFMFIFPGLGPSPVSSIPPSPIYPSLPSSGFLFKPPGYDDALYNSFAGRFASNFFIFEAKNFFKNF